ncbi:MAG: hypothetical protein WCX90_09665, partial [Thiohalomonadaceae bacterium]
RQIIGESGVQAAIIFTVNLLARHDNDLLVRQIDTLRDVVRSVRLRYPFITHSRVVLPEHLHRVIKLPPGDFRFFDPLVFD